MNTPKYEKLNDYIGLHRVVIFGISTELNISKSTNGGFHLFITETHGYTYGFGIEALQAAIDDYKEFCNKSRPEIIGIVKKREIEKVTEYFDTLINMEVERHDNT